MKVADDFVSDTDIQTAAESQKISARRHPDNSSKYKTKHHTRKSTKKFTRVYCPKCDVSLCLCEHLDVHHLGVNYWE